jgi:hypothetical protein
VAFLASFSHSKIKNRQSSFVNQSWLGSQIAQVARYRRERSQWTTKEKLKFRHSAPLDPTLRIPLPLPFKNQN